MVRRVCETDGINVSINCANAVNESVTKTAPRWKSMQRKRSASCGHRENLIDLHGHFLLLQKDDQHAEFEVPPINTKGDYYFLEYVETALRQHFSYAIKADIYSPEYSCP